MSYYGYGSATGRMSPAESWNQMYLGGDIWTGAREIDPELRSMIREFEGLQWSELPADIQELWKQMGNYRPSGESIATESQKLECPNCGRNNGMWTLDDGSGDDFVCVWCNRGTTIEKVTELNNLSQAEVFNIVMEDERNPKTHDFWNAGESIATEDDDLDEYGHNVNEDESSIWDLFKDNVPKSKEGIDKSQPFIPTRASDCPFNPDGRNHEFIKDQNSNVTCKHCGEEVTDYEVKLWGEAYATEDYVGKCKRCGQTKELTSTAGTWRNALSDQQYPDGNIPSPTCEDCYYDIYGEPDFVEESVATEGSGCINCWGDGKVEMEDGTMEICSDCRGTGLENPYEAMESKANELSPESQCPKCGSYKTILEGKSSLGYGKRRQYVCTNCYNVFQSEHSPKEIKAMYRDGTNPYDRNRYWGESKATEVSASDDLKLQCPACDFKEFIGSWLANWTIKPNQIGYESKATEQQFVKSSQVFKNYNYPDGLTRNEITGLPLKSKQCKICGQELTIDNDIFAEKHLEDEHGFKIVYGESKATENDYTKQCLSCGAWGKKSDMTYYDAERVTYEDSTTRNFPSGWVHNYHMADGQWYEDEGVDYGVRSEPIYESKVGNTDWSKVGAGFRDFEYLNTKADILELIREKESLKTDREFLEGSGDTREALGEIDSDIAELKRELELRGNESKYTIEDDFDESDQNDGEIQEKYVRGYENDWKDKLDTWDGRAVSDNFTTVQPYDPVNPKYECIYCNKEFSWDDTFTHDGSHGTLPHPFED